MASPASADEVNVDDHPFRIAGNVKLNSEPLEDILITVAGNGYEVEVETDAERASGPSASPRRPTTRSPSTRAPSPRALRWSTRPARIRHRT